MITATIDKMNYCVSLNGHADYAEWGKDIVCSAVSMLYFTFAETLSRNIDKLLTFNIVEEDDIKITAVPQEGYASIIDMMFEMFITGIRMLHENYPDNVLLIVKG